MFLLFRRPGVNNNLAVNKPFNKDVKAVDIQIILSKKPNFEITVQDNLQISTNLKLKSNKDELEFQNKLLEIQAVADTKKVLNEPPIKREVFVTNKPYKGFGGGGGQDGAIGAISVENSHDKSTEAGQIHKKYDVVKKWWQYVMIKDESGLDSGLGFGSM
jgi:hypothetical protein